MNAQASGTLSLNVQILKKIKGKAFNATLSDESEKEEETPKEEKFLVMKKI